MKIDNVLKSKSTLNRNISFALFSKKLSYMIIFSYVLKKPEEVFYD